MGRPCLKGMSFELDSFLGPPCDLPGGALSTDPSLSCARRPPNTFETSEGRDADAGTLHRIGRAP
jgi:hypothetical protein